LSGWMQAVLDFLADFGPWGLLFALTIEVIPSEIVLAVFGVLVAQGRISFPEAMCAGVLGGITSQLLLYLAGRYGGRPFVERYGRYVFLFPHHIERAERWFAHFGPGAVFSGRFVPVLRHAISIPAGIVRMPLGKFVLYTGLAAIPWTWFFLQLGMAFVQDRVLLEREVHRYTLPFLALALVTFVAYVAFVKYTRAASRRK